MFAGSGCAASGAGGGHQIERHVYPFYLGQQNNGEQTDTVDALPDESTPTDEQQAASQEKGDGLTEMPLYFIDGHTDIPYLAVSDWTKFEATGYPVECQTEGVKSVVTRTDTGYTVTFDASKDTITFFDYNAFFQRPDSQVLVSGASSSRLPEDNENEVFSATEASYNRNGKEVVFELAPYSIDIVDADGECLVPFQTMSDIALSYQGIRMYFNGNCIAFGDEAISMVTEADETPKTELSKELAAFNYNEFCFLMDNFYGLKDTHGIVNFDAFFDEVGLREALSSTDPQEVDDALYDLLSLHLDDIHSTYDYASPLAGPNYMPQNARDNVHGFSRVTNDVVEDLYKDVRASYYPDGCPAYEEVGNTAFITFDRFLRTADNYYEQDVSLDSGDTIELIHEAHEQITRKNSPIQNVVIDLSCNTGGSADTAVFATGWFLGEAPMAMRDTLSGGMSIGMFRVDTNFDHAFNELDELGDRNLYCLISPVSFSCGNLVPAIFKQSARVTLLGRKTYGGSCIVFNASNAIGSRFAISGNTQCSFPKNGAFYNIDEGIDPDYPLSNPKSYFDRASLVEYLNELK